MTAGRVLAGEDVYAADLVEVVRHAGDDDIVPSLRVNATKVDGPSVGLQPAALEPDYSGAPRE